MRVISVKIYQMEKVFSKLLMEMSSKDSSKKAFVKEMEKSNTKTETFTMENGKTI